MSAIDWFYSVSVITVHVSLAVILIRNWLSFHLRWTATAVIVRIFCDMVLLKHYDDVTYFWLYYAFQLVGSLTFAIAWIECREMIKSWELSGAMLVYLLPELWQSCEFMAGNHATACKFADILRPINLMCMIYMCIIMMKRKGNPYAELRNVRP